MEEREVKLVADIAIEALKIVSSDSPEIAEIKKDFGKVLRALNSNITDELIKCNIEISTKYPVIFDIGIKYGLVQVAGETLYALNHHTNLYTLRIIGQCLYDYLSRVQIGDKAERVELATVKIGAKYFLDKALEG